ncbi:MAG: orotate phosphoribosyltransferase [Bacteroidales bacterium]|nr:orotate phosphoribosyltransferase [Bacteroidales bacterium]
MNNMAEQIAERLLQIKAIKLEPTNHFTWASGWFSPIYCDNRKILSFPEARDVVKHAFVKLIEDKFSDFDVIAGVATGAIAHGVLVADLFKKPFVYVRAQAKGHGLSNQIEGHLEKGSKVLVIEDLISTGGSSLSAVRALRDAEAEVVGMAAIFTYNFDVAVNAFKEEGLKLYTLSNYDALIKLAIETGYVKPDDLVSLETWRSSPSTWKKQ